MKVLHEGQSGSIFDESPFMSENAVIPAAIVNNAPSGALRDCVVILNSAAGTMLGDATARDGLEDVFRRNGMRPIVRTCRGGGDIDDFVREALGRGIQTIVAGGGDG